MHIQSQGQTIAPTLVDSNRSVLKHEGLPKSLRPEAVVGAGPGARLGEVAGVGAAEQPVFSPLLQPQTDAAIGVIHSGLVNVFTVSPKSLLPEAERWGLGVGALRGDGTGAAAHSN